MGTLKEEHKPLLPAGIHDVKREEMRDFFTKTFSNTDKRNLLIDKFFSLLDLMNTMKVQAEIWIDGSFTTEKEEPDDIDVVFFIEDNVLRGLPDNEKKTLVSLANNVFAKSHFLCDIYFANTSNIKRRQYWEDWFGKSRLGVPKGIARII